MTMSEFFYKKLKASLTIEAALAMSLFVFGICAMLGPFIILRNNAQTLNQMNTLMSRNIDYSLICDKFLFDNEVKNEQLANLNFMAKNSVDMTSDIYSVYKSSEPTIEACIPLKEKVYDENTKMIEYDLLLIHKIPFSKYFPITVKQHLISSKRAFVGVEGARWNNISKYQSDTEYVYLAKNAEESNIYHTNEFCSYLRHNLESITENEAKGKYKLCSFCNSNFKDEYDTNEVYHCEYGNDYHYIKICPLIYAYIRKVSIESVNGMQKCKRCSIGD